MKRKVVESFCPSALRKQKPTPCKQIRFSPLPTRVVKLCDHGASAPHFRSRRPLCLRMAITHADLSPPRKSSDAGGALGVVLMVCSLLCGLCCFVLCLLAEATRSEVTWLLTDGDDREQQVYKCVYSGSGKLPLTCALGAFVALAGAMVAKHTFILVAISKHDPPALVTWSADSNPSRAITLQACFFFVSTWVCFAVGVVLLMIGIGVESGHLKKWMRPRPGCLVVRQGLFAAAGVFSLVTVFLAAGLYLTALHAQQLRQEEYNVRREALDSVHLYASPRRSPRYQFRRTFAEVSRSRQERERESERGSSSRNTSNHVQPLVDKPTTSTQ